MQVTLPPDLELLINKRLATGAYADVEDVLRCALESQGAEESWTEEERRALRAHLEERFLESEQGELLDGEQARQQLQAMKEKWHKERSMNR